MVYALWRFEIATHWASACPNEVQCVHIGATSYRSPPPPPPPPLSPSPHTPLDSLESAPHQAQDYVLKIALKQEQSGGLCS